MKILIILRIIPPPFFFLEKIWRERRKGEKGETVEKIEGKERRETPFLLPRCCSWGK